MIEIDDGLWIDPDSVIAVRAGFKGQCTVFMSGQSAVDGGFLVDRDAEDLIDELSEAKGESDGRKEG